MIWLQILLLNLVLVASLFVPPITSQAIIIRRRPYRYSRYNRYSLGYGYRPGYSAGYRRPYSLGYGYPYYDYYDY